MIYGFDTDDPNAATGALMVYAIYRSRNRRRYKPTPGMWGQIERFAKASAKRAQSLPAFIEALKPRLMCETIDPRAMKIGVAGVIPLALDESTGELFHPAPAPDQREFLTRALAAVDHRAALDTLYRETAYVILLVRDRLEREKPIESKFNAVLNYGEDDEPQ